MKYLLLLFFIPFFTFNCTAQKNLEQPDPEYVEVLTGRVDKFLKNAGIQDPDQYNRVRQIIVDQYLAINQLDETTKVKIAQLKKESATEAMLTAAKNEAQLSIFARHAQFIAQLQTDLNAEQIEQVKDGMTYGVLPRTYCAYLNLLPQLTEEQKRFIKANLLEARELAMDKGSSDEKHATFGKYKGRINNYLSAQGYDLKKAEADAKQ